MGGDPQQTGGDTELISSGPKPNFWRAPTDNDRGNDFPERCAPWKVATGIWQVTGWEVETPGPAEVRVRFEGAFPDINSTNQGQA